MKQYNLYYKAGEKIIDKKNISKEEINRILESLDVEKESDLRVMQVKDKEEEER